MKLSITITAVTFAFVARKGAMAWPGMAQKVKTLQQRALASNFSDSIELIGDLAHLSPIDLTPVGARVHNILMGIESAESNEINYSVPPLNSVRCAQDTCCVWWYIVDEMVRLFSSPSGRCTNAARSAIRLGFHDASAYSKKHGGRGGADGSIVLARDERDRPLNKGLQEIIKRVEGWHERWGGYGISMADLIQMAATVGTVVCPLYVPHPRPPSPSQTPTNPHPSPVAPASVPSSAAATATPPPPTASSRASTLTPTSSSTSSSTRPSSRTGSRPCSARTRSASSASSTRPAPATRKIARRASSTRPSTARRLARRRRASSSSRATLSCPRTRACFRRFGGLWGSRARSLGGRYVILSRTCPGISTDKKKKTRPSPANTSASASSASPTSTT